MAALVKAIHPRLKDVGFRKRRHTFNRSAEPGIIQVINFQMGQRSLQGQFTINFGIAIEEAWSLRRRDSAGQFPAFVNEYECEYRQRLSQLRGEQRDIWWDLSRQARASAEIGDVVLNLRLEIVAGAIGDDSREPGVATAATSVGDCGNEMSIT